MSDNAAMQAPVSTVLRGEVPPRRALGVRGALLVVAALVVLLAAVRAVSGADDLTSAGAISAALGLAVPIGMAALGGLWSERAGVVNIGLEGMMILGTWGAGWAGYQWGPWAGIVAAVAFGAVGGLLHAVATVTFGVDHIVSGVAVNILGLGITQYLSTVAFAGVPGGGDTQSPQVANLPRVGLPGVDALRGVEDRGWFLVSDLAGIVRGVTTNVSALTLIAVLLVPLSFFLLWRTAFGLRLRSCGENPVAAESLGVNVYRYKYLAVIASGAFAGLGGAFLALVAANFYREGQTGGRGYIGLAAMIFGNWRPGGLAAGAGLFGYTDALRLRGQGDSVHALLLFVAVLLLGLAVYLAVVRRRTAQAALAALVGFAVLAAYLLTGTVPGELTGVTPYVTTLLVLALAAQRLRPPAADGVPYRRGQAR